MTRFQIPKQTLSDWEKSYEKFKYNISTTKKVNVGRKNGLIDIEKEIVNWINHNRKAGYPVSIKSICAFIYSLDSYYKNYSFNILRQKVLRILAKNNLINRKSSQIVQQLPPERNELISLYLSSIASKRKYLRINDNKKHLIVNCDEIVLYYESPDTNVIDISGHKEVIVSPENNAFKRVSIILTICADGTKLEPLVIFKGDNMMNSDTLSNSITKKNNIYISCQYNGWCDEQIFLDWYENIFLKYERYLAKESCLLILDKSPSHINEKILEKFKENNTNYVFIPRGLTKSLQPLDIEINLKFKKVFKEKYNCDKFNNFIETDNRLFSENHKEMIINIINEIWWGEDIINKDLIINSFDKAGITLKIGGSEVKDWKFTESVINKGNMIENVKKYKREIIDSILEKK